MASVDPVYGVNNFNETKVLTEAETLVNNILMILFGKPGFYPSIPWLGMDIQQYLYKFEDEIDDLKIKSKLASQCREFLPNIEDGSMRAIYLVAFIVMIIIIFTSVFCIKNSFDISINEKIKQYGMLRSIGATKKQIKRNVYYEGTILGIIGIPLGIVLD